MFKLCSSAAPAQARNQTTLAEIANSWKEKLAQPEQATPLQAFEPPVHEPEDTRHEAKMRQVQIEGAGRLWAAVRSGSLADRLTLDGFQALLATLPDGPLPSSATETMRKHLEALVSTGFLAPGEDGLFDRAAIAAALAHIDAPDDAAVHAWLAAGADKVQQEATPATAADQTPTENMRVWRASAYPLERTLAGILEIARTSEGRARVACFLPSYTGEGSVSDSALLGADGRLPFTIPMLLAAVEAELPHQAIPVKDAETRRAWIRVLYPQIQFYARRLDDLERKQDLLNEAYTVGLSLGEDAVNQRVAILRVA